MALLLTWVIGIGAVVALIFWMPFPPGGRERAYSPTSGKEVSRKVTFRFLHIPSPIRPEDGPIPAREPIAAHIM
jgi:hypothetical protein